MPLNHKLLTRDQRDLTMNLYISDRETGGRPLLRADEVPLALRLFCILLTDADVFDEHSRLLAELYGGRFQPTPRHDRWEGETPDAPHPLRFTHCELLSEQRANAVAEQGAEVLEPDELAAVLLNPFALHDLAELIRTPIRDGWIDALAEAGRAIRRRHDLEIAMPNLDTKPASKRPRKKKRRLQLQGGATIELRGASFKIGFAEDSQSQKQKIAECLFGDATRDFQLTLHRRRATVGEDCVVQLEVAPAPVKDDLTLSINIKDHTRTFALEVPPSVRLDPDADPPENAFATAAEPVPAEAFDLEGKAEWNEDWPPHLVLRCRRIEEGDGLAPPSLKDLGFRLASGDGC